MIHGRKRLISKNIVYIEGVLRQNDPDLPQKLRPEYKRMHNQILGRTKSSYIIPITHLFNGKNITVLHNPARSFIQMVVHIVAHKQVRYLPDQVALLPDTKSPDTAKQPGVSALLQPVVRINYLKIDTRRPLQTGIDPGTMSSVFLMDDSDNVRIMFFIIICYFSRSIRGAIIHNYNLNIFSAGKQRVDTASHIIL